MKPLDPKLRKQLTDFAALVDASNEPLGAIEKHFPCGKPWGGQAFARAGLIKIEARSAGRYFCRLTYLGLVYLQRVPEDFAKSLDALTHLLGKDPGSAATRYRWHLREGFVETIEKSVRKRAMRQEPAALLLMEEVLSWVGHDIATDTVFQPLVDWLRPYIADAKLLTRVDQWRSVYSKALVGTGVANG